MKTKVNPAAIGMFITGAVVILFVSVALFGGGRLFRQSTSFLLTFREPVTGLDVGAPVKILGVNIGEVRDIWIGSDPTNGSAVINVVIDVDDEQISRRVKGLGLGLRDREEFERALTNGFSGRLEILNLLSGQLYVSLGQSKEQSRFQLGREEEHGFWEIPTLPSAQTEIMASVMSTLDGLAHFDLKTISEQMTNLLVEIRAEIKEVEFGNVSARLRGSLDRVDALLDNDDLRSSLTNLNHALADARQLAGKFNRQADPLLAKLDTGLTKADTALDEATQAFTDLKNLVRPGSPVSHELLTTLEKAGRALDSLRQLADDLQRNPNSILTGKAPAKP
jgi:paraquat-inducible protein B